MKSPKKADFGLYGILTDPVVGYEALAEIMVQRFVRYIQLRMKRASADEVRKKALRLREIVRGESRLIINDHPKIAKDVKADGVHLGQGDVSYSIARQILGDHAIIGISTHNLDQVRAACALKPDYIGIGPVYATPTKELPDPVIGLSGMSTMIAAADVPAVAIGGIDLSNVNSVLDHGAKNLCAVRCINQSLNPETEIDALIAAVEARSKS
jgi:thiamine-phosphate pyrophosphorylase